MADPEQLRVLKEGPRAWAEFVRRKDAEGDWIIDLQDADLRGADLRGVDLAKADLRRSDLRGCVLTGAKLYRASLQAAKLDRAVLKQSDLEEAELGNASMRFADMTDAELSSAKLWGADLTGADLAGATVSISADLHRTVLTGAHLERVDFSGAINVDWADFAAAQYDAETKWPTRFDPGDSGAQMAQAARVDSLSRAGQDAARTAIEPVIGALHQLSQDDATLDADEERFLRAQLDTVQSQLRLDLGGDPRIVELALANITNRFRDKLALEDQVREILLDLGTRPPSLVDEIVDLLNDALDGVTRLGGPDAVADAEILSSIHRLTEMADRTFSAAREVSDSIEKLEGAAIRTENAQRALENSVDDLANDLRDTQHVSPGQKIRSASGSLAGDVASELLAGQIEQRWKGVAMLLVTFFKETLKHFLSS